MNDDLPPDTTISTGHALSTVARACGGSPAGIAHLLAVLAGVQMLTRAGGSYALTPGAATFLVRGRPAYAGDLVLVWTGPAIWEGVAQAVHTGLPAPCEEYHEQDAWLEATRFTKTHRLGERRLAANK
jgi:hypothetical protein